MQFCVFKKKKKKSLAGSAFAALFSESPAADCRWIQTKHTN